VRKLSPRERQILALVAHGQTTKEIASGLGIGERTVKWHVAHLFRKLGASSRAEAVAIAFDQGVLGGEEDKDS
jgi:DNA-binding CsgD family transcriptional regulator